MKKRGFTLIEVIISLAILSILIVMAFDFIFYNDRTYSRVSGNIDESINVRIGLEFLVNQISTGKDIKLIVVGPSGKVYQSSITVQTGTSIPKVYMEIDYEKICIVNNILRNNTLSEQIVSGIKSFSVEDRGNDLYEVSISSESVTLSTIVYRRK